MPPDAVEQQRRYQKINTEFALMHALIPKRSLAAAIATGATPPRSNQESS
jgi:hypothetical protein